MSYIHETAIIGDNVKLGKNNTIYPGVKIGFDGFYKGSDGISSKGTIEIGDNNIIGCNVTIMASEDGVTKIGNDNKIMNNVNIGHNTEIGNKCVISAGVIIPGYVTIKDYVVMGIGSMVRNRLMINEGCMIGMGSVVTKDTDEWFVYQGNPAKKIRLNRVGIDRKND